MLTAGFPCASTLMPTRPPAPAAAAPTPQRMTCRRLNCILPSKVQPENSWFGNSLLPLCAECKHRSVERRRKIAVLTMARSSGMPPSQPSKPRPRLGEVRDGLTIDSRMLQGPCTSHRAPDRQHRQQGTSWSPNGMGFAGRGAAPQRGLIRGMYRSADAPDFPRVDDLRSSLWALRSLTCGRWRAEWADVL